MAEIELSVLQRVCLRRRMPDIEMISREATAWATERNAAGVKADWQMQTEDARIKLKSLYPRILK